MNKTKYCFNTFYEDLDNPYRYESDWFKRTTIIEFEDMMFHAPEESEKYLIARYGDWQTPPPENERVAHGEIIVDFDNDYKKYRT